MCIRDRLEPYPKGSSATEYQRFRALLGASEAAPPWKAIASGFKLTRDYERTLSESVDRAIGSGEDTGPIILQGQTATGKSLSLIHI